MRHNRKHKQSPEIIPLVRCVMKSLRNKKPHQRSRQSPDDVHPHRNNSHRKSWKQKPRQMIHRHRNNGDHLNVVCRVARIRRPVIHRNLLDYSKFFSCIPKDVHRQAKLRKKMVLPNEKISFSNTIFFVYHSRSFPRPRFFLKQIDDSHRKNFSHSIFPN